MLKYKSKIKLSLYIIVYCLCVVLPGHSQETDKKYMLRSPDKKIVATITLDTLLNFSIAYEDKTYVVNAEACIRLDNGREFGRNMQVKDEKRRTFDDVVKPLYFTKQNLREHYNELYLESTEQYAVVFRMFNEGFAYRFIKLDQQMSKVLDEQVSLNFAANYKAYFHPVFSESDYRPQLLTDTLKPNYSSLPMMVKTDDLFMLIHESDVSGYPCMALKSNSSLDRYSLKGQFAKYPKTTNYKNFYSYVLEREDFIAKEIKAKSFPWRIIAFHENELEILDNHMVYLLASDNKISQTDWIKPGKVSWDWWNNLNLDKVPFKSGINTDTYKYFIDFASKNNIPYVNMDLGWSDPYDLHKVSDEVNMEEILTYAKAKNVRIFLWCVWYVLEQQMTSALDQFEKWGIAGLKVDYMERDDQVVVEFQEKLLQEAAKRHLLVNFHGVFHPVGMERAYPNNVNNEGVKGLEWNKFNAKGVGPDHDVMIPFIRMFAGAMDYTPGAMQNYNAKDWKQIHDRPMAQGTICHQLAMYIVYYAPLQMLADAPTAYEKEPQILEFLSQVPTTWDESIALTGKLGEYIGIARRKGSKWYIGAMTNSKNRQLSIPLTFLDDGSYKATLYTDGPNAARHGNDFKVEKRTFTKSDILSLDLAEGGGTAIVLSP